MDPCRISDRRRAYTLSSLRVLPEYLNLLLMSRRHKASLTQEHTPRPTPSGIPFPLD